MAIIKRTNTETSKFNLSKKEKDFIQKWRNIPFNIEACIKDLGILLIKEDMNDLSAYLEKRPNGQWVIGVNKYHHPNRQRFSMAHELGHYINDQDFFKRESRLDDIILLRTNSINEREMRANEFASEILIPSEFFKDLIINQGKRNIIELSSFFKVSPAAIKYKAFKLGLIDRY